MLELNDPIPENEVCPDCELAAPTELDCDRCVGDYRPPALSIADLIPEAWR
jgi:hypothetical protein